MDAALALLIDRRSGSFTLGEVADRAGVSIGSIYGRVDSKEALLRAAHAREMARLNAEQTRVFAVRPPEDETFALCVARTIRTVAELLRRNASVLASFMVLAGHDKAVADLGKPSYDDMAQAFRQALLLRRDEIGHPDPDRAVAWSCTVAYSVLARWLGLGTSLEASGEGEWEQILTDLTAMVVAFLQSPVPTLPSSGQ